MIAVPRRWQATRQPSRIARTVHAASVPPRATVALLRGLVAWERAQWRYIRTHPAHCIGLVVVGGEIAMLLYLLGWVRG